jgi:hypothetical protein
MFLQTAIFEGFVMTHRKASSVGIVAFLTSLVDSPRTMVIDEH